MLLWYATKMSPLEQRAVSLLNRAPNRHHLPIVQSLPQRSLHPGHFGPEGNAPTDDTPVLGGRGCWASREVVLEVSPGVRLAGMCREWAALLRRRVPGEGVTEVVVLQRVSPSGGVVLGREHVDGGT